MGVAEAGEKEVAMKAAEKEAHKKQGEQSEKLANAKAEIASARKEHEAKAADETANKARVARKHKNELASKHERIDSGHAREKKRKAKGALEARPEKVKKLDEAEAATRDMQGQHDALHKKYKALKGSG